MDEKKTNQMDNLPDELPVFPLGGVLLLPRGHLPLNIFEPRYLAMVDHALRTDRLIGVVQPQAVIDNAQAEGNTQNLASMGCAGRITSFEETEDGRYVIALTGICRFTIADEIAPMKGFRRVRPSWETFGCDLEPPMCLDLERKRLNDLLARFFDQHGLTVDWNAIAGAADEKLITALAMVCPFTPSEKQALLKASNCKARAELFMTLLEMAVHEDARCEHTLQ